MCDRKASVAADNASSCNLWKDYDGKWDVPISIPRLPLYYVFTTELVAENSAWSASLPCKQHSVCHLTNICGNVASKVFCVLVVTFVILFANDIMWWWWCNSFSVVFGHHLLRKLFPAHCNGYRFCCIAQLLIFRINSPGFYDMWIFVPMGDFLSLLNSLLCIDFR